MLLERKMDSFVEKRLNNSLPAGLSCIFCDRGKIKEDVLYETANFFVKVGIGIITAGHVMIVSKQHYLCYAEMPHKFELELNQLKNKLIKIVAEHFAEPFLVEYGVWGQTIPHAHIHLIPLKDEHYNIGSIIEKMGKPSGVPFQEGTFQTQRQLYQDNGGYVLLGEKGKMFIFDIKELKQIPKSDTLLDYRPFFAGKGIGTGSWKNLSPEEKLIDEKKRKLTKEKLLPSFSGSS